MSRAGGILGAAMIGGLAVGMVAPELSETVSGVTIPAVGFQTLLTVGSLPTLGGRTAATRGARLALVHVFASALPLVAAALALGLDTALGLGVFVMAVVPPAALLPTFAEVLDLDVPSVVAFCLISYGAALVVTPAALLLVAGATLEPSTIVRVLALGLLLPTLLGRALHRRLQEVPRRARQAAVSGMVFLITLSLGGELLPSLSGESLTAGRVFLVLAIVLARTAGSGWLAVRLSARDLAPVAPLAGGFKNIALTAGASAQLVSPAAAIPALLSFPAEAAYFLYLVRSRRPRTEAAQS